MCVSFVIPNQLSEQDRELHDPSQCACLNKVMSDWAQKKGD